jgi:hypothetical protein
MDMYKYIYICISGTHDGDTCVHINGIAFQWYMCNYDTNMLYVCMYICIWYMKNDSRPSIYIHIYIYIHVYICIYIYTYIYTYIYICIYIYMCKCMLIYTTLTLMTNRILKQNELIANAQRTAAETEEVIILIKYAYLYIYVYRYVYWY